MPGSPIVLQQRKDTNFGHLIAETVKTLLQEYGLKELDSREKNINVFMQHCGIQYQLVGFFRIVNTLSIVCDVSHFSDFARRSRPGQEHQFRAV